MNIFNTLVMQPLAWIINLIYYIVPNYGLAIILFTLIIKAILFPFNLKGMKASMNMQAIQPKLKELQEKYKDNKQKLVEEQQKLYKKENINPMAGCLPQLLPIIILFGLYWVVSQPLTHIMHLDQTQVKEEYFNKIRQQSVVMQVENESFEGIKLPAINKNITVITTEDDVKNSNDKDEIKQYKIENSVPLNDGKIIITNVLFDDFWKVYKNRQVDILNIAYENGVIDEYPINFNFCGLNVAYSPSSMMGKNWLYLLFPLLTGISAWGSQKVMMRGTKYMQEKNAPKKKKKKEEKSEAEQKQESMQNSMNSMMKFMPIFTAWITFQFSAALGLYWIMSNVTQILQQWYINETVRKK